MCSQDRYENEIAFMDGHAERRLSALPADLKLRNLESFEELCEGISYLRSVPSFCQDISGKKILEMGCGDGWVSLRFRKSGADVWACDISPKMIKLAERYARAADMSIEFETMICEEMTYEDDFFDFVFMHFALHHCDISATAKQIHRVLKPGGRAVLAEDYAYNPFLRLYRTLTPGEHTEHEQPLIDDDVSHFVSHFSTHSLEYSGLLDIFEGSNRIIIRPVRPILRKVDDLLYRYLGFLKRYSRIIVIKVEK
jgi:SAM-dependent methyltransferase